MRVDGDDLDNGFSHPARREMAWHESDNASSFRGSGGKTRYRNGKDGSASADMLDWLDGPLSSTT